MGHAKKHIVRYSQRAKMRVLASEERVKSMSSHPKSSLGTTSVILSHCSLFEALAEPKPNGIPSLDSQTRMALSEPTRNAQAPMMSQ